MPQVYSFLDRNKFIICITLMKTCPGHIPHQNPVLVIFTELHKKRQYIIKIYIILMKYIYVLYYIKKYIQFIFNIFFALQ